MLKVYGYAYFPRSCTFCCLYLVWILGSFTLFLLVVTPFPAKDCYMLEITKYNDIEEPNYFSTSQQLCTFSTLHFVYENERYYQTICRYCNDYKTMHEDRNKCHDKFLKQNSLKAKTLSDIDSQKFVCRDGYKSDFIITEEEYNMMVRKRIIFLGIYFIYLSFPLALVGVVILILFLFYQNVWNLPAYFCGHCLWCRKREYEYHQLFDPGSQYFNARYDHLNPFYHWDPVYKLMKKTWKWEEAEMIHWVDNNNILPVYITKWERKYFLSAAVICFGSFGLCFILFVEKLFFTFLPGIVVDLLSPFLNIFVTWNLICFVFFVMYKFSVVRVVTNKRAIKMFRLPLFGVIMHYVLFEDYESVVDMQQCIYLEKGSSKTFIFRTGRPAQCTAAIREFLDIARRDRERQERREEERNLVEAGGNEDDPLEGEQHGENGENQESEEGSSEGETESESGETESTGESGSSEEEEEEGTEEEEEEEGKSS